MFFARSKKLPQRSRSEHNTLRLRSISLSLAKISRFACKTYHFSRFARKNKKPLQKARTTGKMPPCYHLNSPIGRPMSLDDSVSLLDITVNPAAAYSSAWCGLRSGAREGIQKRTARASHHPAAFCFWLRFLLFSVIAFFLLIQYIIFFNRCQQLFSFFEKMKFQI